MLEGGHVTRTRWAYRVTAASLSVLQRAAYHASCRRCHVYIPCMVKNTVRSSPIVPVLEYDNLTLALCHAVCVISERRQLPNFQLYVETLGKLAPIICTHYSRWVPVHVINMIQLKDTHPSVYRQFARGHFKVQKTGHTFSPMALDQNHEVIKGDGGGAWDWPKIQLHYSGGWLQDLK